MFVKRSVLWAGWISILILIALFNPWYLVAESGSQTSVETNKSVSTVHAENFLMGVVPDGPGFLMVSSFSFRPWSLSYPYAYSSADLYNSGSEVDFYESPLNLPNKITLTKLVVYFLDNSDPFDIEVYLRRLSGNGSYEVLAEGYSTGSSDLYRTLELTEISFPEINQQYYSYNVEVALPPTSDIRLVSIRLDYAPRVTLPLLQK
jgi:hypothetical protein